MADDDDRSQDAEDGAEEGQRPTRRRLPGRSLVLFVFLPLLVAGSAAGAYLSGMLGAGDEEAAVAAPSEPKIFYELPEMLVNLASDGKSRPQYMKLVVSLELSDSEARDALEPVLPRIIDLFQVYLRELRMSDLEGSAGVFRLKEELERRINLEIHPYVVDDVLFREIIVQ